MAQAETREEFITCLRQMEKLTLRESQEWLSVMHFHDIEAVP